MISDETRKEIIFAFSRGASVAEVCVTYKIGKTLAYELRKFAVNKEPELPPSILDVGHDNSSVLVIADDHEPYSHPDKYEFLEAVKAKYGPTRIIHTGDEVDSHYLNFHTKEATILNPVGEKKRAIAGLSRMQELFPKMDLLHSNHGDLTHRKAKAAGMLPDDIKSRRDRLHIEADWEWHNSLEVDFPNGDTGYFVHAYGANVLRSAEKVGMSLIQGHYHTSYSLSYWSTPKQLHFALQMPCLIDTHCDAFNYINTFKGRIMVGVVIIENGYPKLIPLVKRRDGRWDGTIA